MSVYSPVATDLNQLLEDVCEDLQITSTQYSNAEAKYGAIGRLLEHPQSPLAHLAPLIYPQGSLALQTTVKPRDHEEYDLDLVVECQWFDNPIRLYETTFQWLASHRIYEGILERKNRCIRLKYAGQFHLDILPARSDRSSGGTCIEVPDRELRDWMPSNPRGYRAWFERQSSLVLLRVAEKQMPLPAHIPSDEKTPLQRVVQLLKRHRDIVFFDDEDAPRSIVLTTLAGSVYRGDATVVGALVQVISHIDALIEQNYPNQLIVLNPSNPAERFSDSWKSPDSYTKFARFIHEMKNSVSDLVSLAGLPSIRAKLSTMFGEEVSFRAVEAFSKRLSGIREAGALRVGTQGVTISSTLSRAIPRHTNYGS
jgi:hypothetical protein